MINKCVLVFILFDILLTILIPLLILLDFQSVARTDKLFPSFIIPSFTAPAYCKSRPAFACDRPPLTETIYPAPASPGYSPTSPSWSPSSPAQNGNARSHSYQSSPSWD